MIETTTKERPLLLNGPMSAAVWAGRKTQTRRIIDWCRLSPEKRYRLIDDRIWVEIGEQQYDPTTKKTIFGGECRLEDDSLFYSPIVVGKGPRGEGNPATCPYGKVGDRLWVKETWRTGRFLDTLKPTAIADKCLDAGYSKPWAPIAYEAGGGGGPGLAGLADFGGLGKTRVSIHMPRWASRILLEITEVRVQRLQEISEADAYAEGVTIPSHHAFASNGNPELRNEARCAFRTLWDSINGAGSWDLNPWVWALSFKRIEAAA